MIVVIRYVFETNAKGFIGQPIPGAIRPFDDDDFATVDNVIPRHVREIIRTTQSIKVQVIDSCIVGVILVHERERRTGHIFTDSHTATNRLRQRGLSGAEFAFDSDDHWCLQSTTEFLPPDRQLVNRESEVRNYSLLASGLQPLA